MRTKPIKRSHEYVELELKKAFRCIGLDKWSAPLVSKIGLVKAPDGRMMYTFSCWVPVDYSYGDNPMPVTRTEIANKVYHAEADWLGGINRLADGIQDFPGIAPVHIRTFLEGCSAKRTELLEAIIRELSGVPRSQNGE